MTLPSILRRPLVLTLVATSLISVAVLAGSRPVLAVSTLEFLLDSAAALQKGEIDGTAVRSDGRITRGVHTQRFAIDDAALAYSMARLDDGVAIGTGNDGRVYRLSGGTLSLLAETGTAVVTALVPGPAGVLYAGTLPDGQIMAIDVASQRVRPFAQPEGAEHVWALAYDAQRKRLYAATGPDGKIFVIDSRGQAEVYYASDAQHIMSLALDTDGTLYAGTSDEALVLRIRAPGRGEVVRDLPGNEVTSLDVRDGVIAATANEFPEPKNVGSDANKGASLKGPSRANPPQRPKPARTELWRIDADGRAEALLGLDKNHFTAVQLAADGTIFVATGQDGRIYRVEPDGTHALWVDVDERQVLALDVRGSEPLFVTGDAAAVYRVQTDSKRPAYWTSEPLDSRFGARWGIVTWRASGPLEVQTRSGHTRKPDATWSDWSSPRKEPGPVTSPAGRFLQMRVRLAGEAEVYALTAYYLPQNQPARITAVEVQQLSAKEKGAKTSGDAERKSSEGASAAYGVRWKVDNPDEDSLRYRLYYRAENQKSWRAMLRESEIVSSPQYRWDTSGIPDGFYRVRVVASDELDNPAAFALSSEGLSEPIRVDNHAPRIEGLRYAQGKLQGRAIDSLSRIAKLEYAVDGGDWQLFFPSDALLDSRLEAFALELPEPLGPGSHILAVRASDTAGNSRTAELAVEVSPRRR